MAASSFNGWVEGDVAIEIIGKMIAEESRRLDDLLLTYDAAGIYEDDDLVQTNEDYQSSTAKLDQFHAEIDAIHAGKDLEFIFKKVQQEYAPYIRERYNSLVLH